MLAMACLVGGGKVGFFLLVGLCGFGEDWVVLLGEGFVGFCLMLGGLWWGRVRSFFVSGGGRSSW